MGEPAWQSQPIGRLISGPVLNGLQGNFASIFEPKIAISRNPWDKAPMSDHDRKPRFPRGPGKGYGKGPGKGFGKGRDPGGKAAWPDRGTGPDAPAILYGWHTVAAALANPQRRIRKLWVTENAARRLADEHIDLPLTPEIVRPAQIDLRLGPDAVHQGLLAEADP